MTAVSTRARCVAASQVRPHGLANVILLRAEMQRIIVGSSNPEVTAEGAIVSSPGNLCPITIKSRFPRHIANVLGLWGLLWFAVGCSNSTSTIPSQQGQNGPSGPFSNSSLKGNYTYLLGGNYFNSTSTNGPYERGGVFVADGNGNVTSGVDDIAQGGSLSSNKLTGSYAIAGDGTGLMTLNTSDGQQLQWALTIAPDGRVYVIDFDQTGSGSGQAVPQNTSAFSEAPAATFVFRLHSYEPNLASQGSVSAVGNIVFDSNSVSGEEDIVRFEALSSLTFSGSLTAPDGNGRGTLDLTDSAGFATTYLYYMIDSQTLNLLETDSGHLGNGTAVAQNGVPFSNASLQNGFTFRSFGDTQNHLDGVNGAGAFASDGAGHITSGNYDANQDGVPLQNASLTGTYSVETDGRVSLTLNPTLQSQTLSPIQDIAWMIDSTRALFLVNVSGLAEDGRMLQQQGGPFSASSLSGNYSFLMFGYDQQSPIEVDRVGAMAFDGSSTVSLTDYFVNRGGSRSETQSSAGNYSVSANGRVSASISGVSNNLIVYLNSDSAGDLILGDQGAELSGSIAQVPSP